MKNTKKITRASNPSKQTIEKACNWSKNKKRAEPPKTKKSEKKYRPRIKINKKCTKQNKKHPVHANTCHKITDFISFESAERQFFRKNGSNIHTNAKAHRKHLGRTANLQKIAYSNTKRLPFKAELKIWRNSRRESSAIQKQRRAYRNPIVSHETFSEKNAEMHDFVAEQPRNDHI